MFFCDKFAICTHRSRAIFATKCLNNFATGCSIFFFSVLGHEAKALSIIRESRSWKNNAFFQKVGIKIIVFHKKTGDLTWRLYSSITEKTRKH